MISIHKWDDLREFGITPLTGEACGIGMRLLCDLTEEGAKYVEDFLGNTVKLVEDSNWNSGAKYSVMLSRGIFTDLAAFILCSKYGNSYVRKDGMIFSTIDKDDDEMITRYNELSSEYGIDARYLKRGTAGTRNQHVMSGRVS